MPEILSESSAETARGPAPEEELPRLRERRRHPGTAGRVGKLSGVGMSLVLHGGLVALALLTTHPSFVGHGGGRVGGQEPGASSGEAVAYTAHLGSEGLLDPGPRPRDGRQFTSALAEEVLAPDGLPPPPQDFLQATQDARAPAPSIPSRYPPESIRPGDAYSRLPGPDRSPGEDLPTGDAASPGADRDLTGTSDVPGIGGETGGAGDGRESGLFTPAPEYPASARRRHLEGAVTVQVDVAPDGHCENPRLVESSGWEALDAAAIAAIRRWTYVPVASVTSRSRRVRFVFELKT